MKPRPDCIPCILHQALQVARAASDDEWSQRKVLAQVLQTLPEADWDTSPADILEDVFAAARDTLKVADPYERLRLADHDRFRTLAKAFRERLASSDDPFALATHAAAAANLVDERIFARFSRRDAQQAFDEAFAAGFALGDPSQLREAADAAKDVLYLLDNAGEAHFDKLLIEQLEALGKHVRIAVRGGGLLHDATLEDALSSGMGPEGPVTIEEAQEPIEDEPEPDEGAAPPPPADQKTSAADLFELKPGRLAASRGKELQAAIAASDLIIAKGSAYYETFTARDKDVVFLLRAKCGPVAHSLGVPVGALVLHRVSPATASSEP